VKEANELLTTVRPIVERMVEQRRELVTKANGGGFNPRLPAEIETALEAAVTKVSTCVEELTGLGVQVKDLDSGLVDFPALRDGEEVLLCWQLGEDEIGWWHTLDGGFAGRQPL